MRMKIYIPTSGRSHRNMSTMNELIKYAGVQATLVCPENEWRKYKGKGPLIACPCDGIGNTRQWILENSDADIVVMMDDDMWFSYRPDPSVPKLERCYDLRPMLQWIVDSVANGYIHGGVAPRGGSNRIRIDGSRIAIKDLHLTVKCQRVNNIHFLDRIRVLATGVAMNSLPVMEDFHFTLSLLTKGYPNIVMYDYVWNQYKSGSIGGCSRYRTPQMQEESANFLHNAFPSYVRVVDKKVKDTSGAWRGMTTRKDVVVQWLKAAIDGGIDI